LSGINLFGGTYALSLSNSRQTTDSTFNTLNPQYPSSLSLNITQPLWRGLRYDENRNRLQVARKNQQLSAKTLRRRVIAAVAKAVQAYWELDYAWNSVNVQAEAVKLAERQYDSNRRQAEQGILAPIDVSRPDAGHHSAEPVCRSECPYGGGEQFEIADAAGSPRPHVGAALIPETPLDMNVAIPSLEDAVKQALTDRPRGVETALALDINGMNTRLAREAAKPRIDAFANLTSAGLAGAAVPVSPFLSHSFRAQGTLPPSSTAPTGVAEQCPPRKLSFGAGRRPAVPADPQPDAQSQAAIAVAEGAACVPWKTRSAWRWRPTRSLQR
jgi:HAE1 family hydrophobic/amphiphilic exporter-1